MTAKFRIEGGGEGHVATVVTHQNLPAGLVAYTHPLDHKAYSFASLTSTDFGANMAINPAATAPTTTLIHNGTDTVAWTAAAVTGGGFVFNSTAQALDGTQSIDATVSANNDTAGFTAPAPLNPTSFTSFRTGIYITAFPTSGTKDVVLQWYNGGAPVGNSVSIKPYVNILNTNVWQIADIPLVDFGLAGVPLFDELRITTVDSGQGAPPDYYLDVLQLVQTTTGSGTASYRFTPNYGEDYYVKSLQFIAYSTSAGAIDPTKYFGLTALTSGTVLQIRNKSRVLLSLIARDVWDMLRVPSADVDVKPDGSTGGTFVVRFELPEEQMKLFGSQGTYLEVIVRDDLSGLSRLECSAQLARLEDVGED